MTHDEIMRLCFAKLPEQVVINVDSAAGTFEPVFVCGQGRFDDLLRGAPLLYQTLQQAFVGLGAISDILENADCHALTVPIEELRASFQMAMRIAQSGIEQEMERNTKHGRTH